jgi:hypothetical protein
MIFEDAIELRLAKLRRHVAAGPGQVGHSTPKRLLAALVIAPRLPLAFHPAHATHEK